MASSQQREGTQPHPAARELRALTAIAVILIAMLVLAGAFSFLFKEKLPYYGSVWHEADHNPGGALVAVAGENQTVVMGDSVTLNASGSTPGMDYIWWFEYGGENVSVSGLTADYEFEKPGEYVVTLVVREHGTAWASDNVTVTVKDKTFVEKHWLLLVIGTFVAIMLVQYISVLRKAKFVSPRTVALYGVLGALTAAVTMSTVVPFAPTKGYFNLGDAVVFFSALTFGWRTGAICGGFGSAAADILLGSGYFAPLTLVAKGGEGLVAGFIGRLGGGKRIAVVLAIATGCAWMVATYFFGELFLLNVGLGPALVEAAGNAFQAAFGGTLGALLSFYVTKSYPSIARSQR